MPQPQGFLIPPDQQAGWAVVDEPAQMFGGPSEDHGAIRNALSGLLDLGIGPAKGVASTLNDVLGTHGVVPNLLRKVPGMERLSGEVQNLTGLQPYDLPEEPSNALQAFGKGAEQIGEFLIPANLARKMAIKGLVSLIPDAASPSTMKVLNKVGAVIGRTMGEASSAASVAALHGEENPDTTALIAGAGPLVGSAAAGAVRNPTVQKALSIALASLPQGMLPAGLAGRMGSFNLIRQLVADTLSSRPVQRNVPRLVTGAGRIGAGAYSESDR